MLQHQGWDGLLIAPTGAVHMPQPNACTHFATVICHTPSHEQVHTDSTQSLWPKHMVEDARCMAAGQPALLWKGLQFMHLIYLELTMLVIVSGLSWRAKFVIYSIHM